MAEFSGRLPFTRLSSSRYDCVILYIPSRLADWTRDKLPPNKVVTLYYSSFTSGGCIEGDCSDILLRFPTSSMNDLSTSGLV